MARKNILAVEETSSEIVTWRTKLRVRERYSSVEEAFEFLGETQRVDKRYMWRRGRAERYDKEGWKNAKQRVRVPSTAGRRVEQKVEVLAGWRKADVG